jgi:hypothetical protein
MEVWRYAGIIESNKRAEELDKAMKKTTLENILSEIVRIEHIRGKKLPLLPIVEIYNSYNNSKDPMIMRLVYDYLYFDDSSSFLDTD